MTFRSTSKIVLWTTRGRNKLYAAMIGRHHGSVKHLCDINPNTIPLHYIIHDSLLCSKLKDYANIMASPAKKINFLEWQSWLLRWRLRLFLNECEVQWSHSTTSHIHFAHVFLLHELLNLYVRIILQLCILKEFNTMLYVKHACDRYVNNTCFDN